MPALLLDDYATLQLTGPDAARFLQGQITQDVARLTADVALEGAVLTPQGRVIALVTLVERDGDLVLIVPTALAQPLAEHLKRFVLRAKVKIEIPGESLAVAAVVADSDTDAEAPILALPPGTHRREANGTSVVRRPGYAILVAPRSALRGPAHASADREALELAAIRAGEPAVVAATSGEWIPQMLNLDATGAVSFTKGCYAGQEIVARTQHLGRIKRRMLAYRSQAHASVPAPGAALLDGEVKVGEVVRAAAAGGPVELLAVVSLESRAATLVDAGGTRYLPVPLPYPLD